MVVRVVKKSNETISLCPGMFSLTLKKPYEVEINGQKVIRFPFTAAGMACNIKPNYFYLFKSEFGDDKLKIQRFHTLAMAIRKCFDITEPFCEESYEKWVGKKGIVVMGKQKNGKIGVIFYMPNKGLKESREKIIEKMHTFEYGWQ